MSNNILELSEDQNNLTVDGVKYEAVPHRSCNTCVFIDSSTICINRAMSKCASSERKDNRSIVWHKITK